MILLGFDMETTGLDFQKDRPIEIGYILYSTAQKRCLESSGYLVKTDVPISPLITKLLSLLFLLSQASLYLIFNGLILLKIEVQIYDNILYKNKYTINF